MNEGPQLMPAWRLDAQDRSVGHFDVGGSDGSAPGFVGHVVLCLAEQSRVVNLKSRSVDAVHMGPPLKTKPHQIDAIGSAELDTTNTQPSERRQIKVFVDDRLQERKAQEARLARLRGVEKVYCEYIVYPHYREPEEDAPLWRFNCAGFVIKAYEEANIALVDAGKAPPVTLDKVKQAYPQLAPWLDRQDFRERLGIGQGSAWPVLFAGYVLNALNRDAAAIRKASFVPSDGDEYFPPVRP